MLRKASYFYDFELNSPDFDDVSRFYFTEIFT